MGCRANVIASQNQVNKDLFCSALDFSVKQSVKVPWLNGKSPAAQFLQPSLEL